MGTGLQSLAPFRESGCKHPVALLELACRSRTLHAPLLGSGVEWAASLGSGSLAFAAPSSTFARRRAGPRGLPLGGWPCETPSARRALRRPGSSFRALLPRWAWALLSWPCPLAPLHRHGLARPLPGTLSGSLRPEHSHVSGPVPPPRFLTVLAACSARASRVCCNPLPVRGSPCFRPRRAPLGTLLARPHGAARTLRRMPLVDSRTASPQPLPSCRCRALHVRCAPSCRRLGRSLALRVVGGRWPVGSPALGVAPGVAGSSAPPGLPGLATPSSIPPLHVRPEGQRRSVPSTARVIGPVVPLRRVDHLLPEQAGSSAAGAWVAESHLRSLTFRAREPRSSLTSCGCHTGSPRCGLVGPPVSVGRSPSSGLLPRQVTVGVRCIPSPEGRDAAGSRLRVSRRRTAPLGAAPARPSRSPSRGSGSNRAGRLQGLAPPTSP
jgi:hypothetical protein